MRFGLAKRYDHTPSQKAPELGLLWRPADLGNHRRGNQWNNAKFQTGLVFSPRSPLVSIGGHENAYVAMHTAFVNFAMGTDRPDTGFRVRVPGNPTSITMQPK